MTTEEKWYPPKAVWLGNAYGCPPFDVLNQMLYKAVEDNPSNADHSQIIGKLMLIGRVYSASIERRKTNRHEKDERQALQVFIAAAESISRSNVEAMLARIMVSDPLTPERIDEAAAVHLELCTSLSTANHQENSSLASKYLHFHRPNFFPIVDSFVRTSWSWVMDAKDEDYTGFTTFGKVARYRDWCEKCLAMQEDIRDHQGHAVSLRQVDNYLLSIMSLDAQGNIGLPQLPG